ncbi:hypothetical protein FGB62_36g120 [Gracilaria domingensis]|nr:hypothetical protein FGB62_36g120 [Gracilaria domingensis]
MWTTVLRLGEMSSFPVAAEMVGLALVATAFGYTDAIKGASSVRARIKEMGTKLREQYDIDMITKNISQGDEIETDNMSTTRTNQIVFSFEYNMGDFGDFGDEDVEDWDVQLERELNITIQRCNDETSNGDAPFVWDNDPSPLTREVFSVPLPAHLAIENLSSQENADLTASDTVRRSSQPQISRWATGPQHGNLFDAELCIYVGRLAGCRSGKCPVSTANAPSRHALNGDIISVNSNLIDLVTAYNHTISWNWSKVSLIDTRLEHTQFCFTIRQCRVI